jgi:transposase
VRPVLQASDPWPSPAGSSRPNSTLQRGCELIYLPAYSPDLNPIEEAFAKIESLLRKAVARTKEALVGAMARHYLRLPQRTSGAASRMSDTVLRLNYREIWCKKFSLGMRNASA